MERVCESCGGTDDELVLVQRVDLGAEQPGPSPPATSGAEELWCFSCRSMYPHEEADGNLAP